MEHNWNPAYIKSCSLLFFGTWKVVLMVPSCSREVEREMNELLCNFSDILWYFFIIHYFTFSLCQYFSSAFCVLLLNRQFQYKPQPDYLVWFLMYALLPYKISILWKCAGGRQIQAQYMLCWYVPNDFFFLSFYWKKEICACFTWQSFSTGKYNP